MNPLLKWGLILGGGYLVLRNINLPGFSFPPTNSDASGGSNGAGAGSGAGNGGSAASGSVPATTPVPAAVIDSSAAREALIRRAANGDATAVAQADSAGIKLNADQWNYYRAAGGGSQTTVDLFPTDNRDFQMLASDYIARRKSAGLSGLRGWGSR